MSLPRTTELVKFRLFKMPCCEHLLCWVNPRIPSYCPQCGASVLLELKFHPDKHTLVLDDKAQLRFNQELVQLQFARTKAEGAQDEQKDQKVHRSPSL